MAALRQGCCSQNVFVKFKGLHRYALTRPCSQLKVNNAEIEELQVDESHYPPIKPNRPPGSWGKMRDQEAWRWYDKSREIQELETVQDKIDYLTESKFRTWKVDAVTKVPHLFDYQCNITKTYPVIQTHSTGVKHSKLPKLYFDSDFKLDENVVDTCKQILQNYKETVDYVDRTQTEKIVNSARSKLQNKFIPVVDNEISHLRTKELLMSLVSYLGGHYDHIRRSTMDESVRIAATWDRFNFPQKGNPYNPVKPKHIFNHSAFFGEHIVNFQIRKDRPLPQFISMSDPLMDNVYPNATYLPTNLGQFQEILKRGFEPGYNIGDPNAFVHVNVVMLNERHLLELLNTCGEAVYEEALNGYAVTTGFLSTVAQAHSLGYNMHEDLDQPITTQTIITDGDQFMFSTYQLNTLELWKDERGQPYHNVCWISQPQDMWTKTEINMEGENVEEYGIDGKTLEILLKFLVISPTEENLVKIKPPTFSDYSIPKEGEKFKAFTDKYQGLKDFENGFKIKVEVPVKK